MKHFFRKYFFPLQQKYFIFTVYSQSNAKCSPVRQDVISYKIQEEIYIDVFWKILPIGKGPALSILFR